MLLGCSLLSPTFEGVEREIPRCQRRGAIIILGTIALAKPEVVSERLETLLKVGLGRFGKVRVY